MWDEIPCDVAVITLWQGNLFTAEGQQWGVSMQFKTGTKEVSWMIFFCLFFCFCQINVYACVFVICNNHNICPSSKQTCLLYLSSAWVQHACCWQPCCLPGNLHPPYTGLAAGLKSYLPNAHTYSTLSYSLICTSSAFQLLFPFTRKVARGDIDRHEKRRFEVTGI